MGFVQGGGADADALEEEAEAPVEEVEEVSRVCWFVCIGRCQWQRRAQQHIASSQITRGVN